MPRVKISVGDVKCIRQADPFGKDDVYWLANLRHGKAVDHAHTDLAALIFDTHYDTCLPEMLSIGAGETARFTKDVIYDKDVPVGSYLFGKIHFMERDTPVANYMSKVMGILGVIVVGLAIGAALGFGVGFGLAGLQGAVGGGFMVVASIAVVGFVVAAAFDVIGGKDNDAHLGGMKVVIGPIAGPPPDNATETLPLTLTPAGKMHVVDVHGANLTTYSSSHGAGHHADAGHKYETALRMEITGGHR